MRTRPESGTPHAGLSLLEMILVLAVLVAVAAMVLPALQGPMSDQRLRKSADLVRSQWTKARVKAMQTGRLYVFRYDIATDRYGVQPWYGETDTIEASDTGEPVESVPVKTAETGKDQLLGISGVQLPAGITFFSGETVADVRTQEVLAASEDASGMTGGPPPIVFYPDGTATDARVVLTNQRFFIELSLRGLTGLAKVSDLLSIEELTPESGAAP